MSSVRWVTATPSCACAVWYEGGMAASRWECMQGVAEGVDLHAISVQLSSGADRVFSPRLGTSQRTLHLTRWWKANAGLQLAAARLCLALTVQLLDVQSLA